jgi:hypothetical protein
MNTYFKRLRKQLPYRYTTAISNMAEGISPRQVKGVFSGEISNINTVERVVKAALKLSHQSRKVNRNLLRKLKTATAKPSKKAA